jgi:multiple sugar transport system ATP-binding protein
MTVGQRIVVLRQGVIQQDDTPLNVYQRPINRFVASFIGTPPMNFLPATIAEGKVLWQGHCLPVTPPAVEGPVTVGVRPEDVLLHDGGPETFPAAVDSIERMGHETLVHLDVHGCSLVVRSSPAEAVLPGQTVRIALRPERLHLFAVDGVQQRLD